MIVKTSAKYLHIHIARPGPYIVYFNGLNEENKKIVDYVHKIENTESKIQFLEVDWIEYSNIPNKARKFNMNCIYLYYNNKLIEKLETFDQFKFKNILVKSAECYNKNISKRLMYTKNKMAEYEDEMKLPLCIKVRQSIVRSHRRLRLKKEKLEKSLIKCQNTAKKLQFSKTHNILDDTKNRTFNTISQEANTKTVLFQIYNIKYPEIEAKIQNLDLKDVKMDSIHSNINTFTVNCQNQIFNNLNNRPETVIKTTFTEKINELTLPTLVRKNNSTFRSNVIQYAPKTKMFTNISSIEKNNSAI